MSRVIIAILFCYAFTGVLLPSALAVQSASQPVRKADLFANFKVSNRIDELVLVTLKAKGIPPSDLCTDEVFIRRVFLDVIGTLPSGPEVRKFLADPDHGKRAKLIDSLLDRPEFAMYWGLKWGDLLRIKAEFPSNLWPNAVQAYDRWVRQSLLEDKPYDQFVREILTSSGSNFRAPPANFFRAFQDRSPRQVAENVALIFMGVRLKSAGFTEEQIQAFSAFFAKIGYKGTDEWKEEVVFFNPDAKYPEGADGKPVGPRALDGQAFDIPAQQDPRVALADWLTRSGNPWFAKCMVNRIWFWLLGRGVIHEPDDIRDSNPPWNAELLAVMQQELVSHKYALKSVYRLILNSSTYQLSSTPNEWNKSDTTGFSHYRIRRLDAEPLLDAINQITGTGEKYTSAIPEPFTFLPDDQRAICLADGSIELPFLELFGRPPRNTSFESERSSAPSVFQAQHLLNSSHILDKIEKSRVLLAVANGQEPTKGVEQKQKQKQKQKGKGKGKADLQVVGGLSKPFELDKAAANPKLVESCYLRILSRFPTEAEQGAACAYLSSPKRKPAEAVCDLVWALINSSEFSLKH